MRATIITLSILLTNLNSFSCTCIGGKRSVEEGLKWADHVLVGEVINGKRVIKDTLVKVDSLEEYSYRMEYQVKVSKEFKGKVESDTVTVHTGIGNGDCGFPFEPNNRYVIYAEMKQLDPKGKEVIYTDICTRTRKYDEKEVKKLKRARIKK